MKSIKKYNAYIFISTFTRNIIDIYSVVYLYQKGLNIKEIIFIYAMCYFLGPIISYLSITIGNKIGYKYILIASSIITSITVYIINNTINIYLISLFLSLSMFTYHPIKHIYGIKLLRHKKEIGNTLIFTYIATLLSSYIVINNIKITYLILLSFMSIIPAFLIDSNKHQKIVYSKINKNKLDYFIFDQFRIIFTLLESLYLYLIANNISYVGIFNIILTLSSVLSMYILANKIELSKKYKYINIIYIIILIIKLNINIKSILLIIAIAEGICIKANELVSNMNLYDNKIVNEGYIITSELIICLTKSLILSIIYFITIDLKIIMYLLIIGIFILSFKYKKDTLTWVSFQYS